ncbi:MAG: hypothetical protein ACI9XJ_000092 [Marivirga sp.]|jgi:hypothetical protein
MTRIFFIDEFKIMEKNRDLKYWESFFQSMQMTYYSLLAAPLFIFAIAFLRAENGNKKLLALNSEIETILVSIVSVLALAVMVAIYLYADNKYKVAQKEEVLERKLIVFRSASLLKYVALCVAQVVTVIGFAVTYHNALMGIFTALLLYSSFFRPEIATAKKVLKLSKSDFDLINYKKQLIL